jgi:hypothetical protein
MKKKVVSCLLALGMALSLLVGCGSSSSTTSTNATNEVESVVASSEDETNTQEEVDMGDLVFYKDLASYGEYSISDVTFESTDEFELTSTDSFPVYNIDGICVGYIKSGCSVTITEKGVSSSWFRFENPVEGTDYDYLYGGLFNIPEYGTASNIYTTDEFFALLDEQLEERYEKASASREKFLNENPDVTSEDYPEEIKCTRVDSKDGLTFDGESSYSLYKEDCDGDVTEDGTIAIYAYSLYRHYEEIYFEIIKINYDSFSYNLYVKEKED